MTHNAKYRGDRKAVHAKVPRPLVDLLDERAAEVGSTRVDYVWHILATTLGRPDMDPLGEDRQLQLGTTRTCTTPTRAA